MALVVGGTVNPVEPLKLIFRVQPLRTGRCGFNDVDVRVIDRASLVFLGRLVSEGVLIHARVLRITWSSATSSGHTNRWTTRHRLRSTSEKRNTIPKLNHRKASVHPYSIQKGANVS